MTPDGWVTDPEASPSLGLVELKNPYSYRDLSVSDAILLPTNATLLSSKMVASN